jgi:hypothetical protein
LLYIGGSYINQVNGQNAGDLTAIDVATLQLVNWMPSITHTNLGGVLSLHIVQNTLYISGGFNEVGGQVRANIAAIELYTGTVKSWNFAANFSAPQNYADIKSYNNKLIIGGNFGTPGLPTDHACALVDTVTGLSIEYLFRSGGLFGNGINSLYWAAGVNCLALSGDTLFTFSSGTFDTRITAINLANNNTVLWAKYFNIIAAVTRMEVTGGALYAGGQNFTDIYITNATNDDPLDIERKIKGVVKLNSATGNFINWLPDPVGLNVSNVFTMALAANNILVGGNFSHVNGIERTGIVMLKAGTQQVLPFNINLSGHSINAFKIIDSTLYAAGTYIYINGINQPKSVLAFNINSGVQLPWNPVNLGTAYAIEANSQYVFLGGQLNEPSGGLSRTNLFAINRQSDALAQWAPNPNSTIAALHLSDGKLYVGGYFNTIASTARTGIGAFDTSTLSLTSFNPNPNSSVNAINSIPGTIWIGGSFYQIGGNACSVFAGINAQSGTINNNPVTSFNGGTVYAITVKGCYVHFGGGFRLNGTEPCNNLGVYDMYNKTLLTSANFCQNVDDLGGNIKALAHTANDLYFGGNFTRVNAKANATNIERIRFSPGFYNGCGEYITVQNGNWNTASTWQGGSVPPSNARIKVRHSVTVSSAVTCFSLLIEPGGNVNVNGGVVVKVVN